MIINHDVIPMLSWRHMEGVANLWVQLSFVPVEYPCLIASMLFDPLLFEFYCGLLYAGFSHVEPHLTMDTVYPPYSHTINPKISNMIKLFLFNPQDFLG